MYLRIVPAALVVLAVLIPSGTLAVPVSDTTDSAASPDSALVRTWILQHLKPTLEPFDFILISTF